MSKAIDLESIRVIKKMPKWIPAKKNGVVVKSIFEMPLTFTVQ